METVKVTPSEYALMKEEFTDSALALQEMLPQILEESANLLNAINEVDEETLPTKLLVMATVTYVETFSHCFRGLARGFHPEILDKVANKKTLKMLEDEKSVGADERIKRSHKLIAKLMQLGTMDVFESQNWHNFRKVLEKRRLITHPKNIEDLTLKDENNFYVDSCASFLGWSTGFAAAVYSKIHETAKQKSAHHP